MERFIDKPYEIYAMRLHGGQLPIYWLYMDSSFIAQHLHVLRQ